MGCRDRDSVSLQPNARYDTEGYFIVKGSEKTLQTQRKLHINRYYIFPATNTKWTWMSEIRCCHAAKIRSTSTLRINIKCGPGGSGVLRGCVEMPYLSVGIPLLAVCMALGFRSAEEVATAAASHGALSGTTPVAPGSVWDTHAFHTTRLWILSLLRDELLLDAHGKYPPFETMGRVAVLQWIGDVGSTKVHRPVPDAGGSGSANTGNAGSTAASAASSSAAATARAKDTVRLMASEFLPQLGLNSLPLTIMRKGQYFAMMLGWLADVARGLAPADDRDHAGNRQYDTAGMLCATLARQHYLKFRKKLEVEIRRFAQSSRWVGIPELLNVKRMTDGFTYALSTGNWGLQKGGSSQTGVAQMLNRLNPVASMSHVRRTDTPLKREGKQAKPRQIHTSSFGHTCPAETPEGPACGLVEQLAQGVWVCQGHAAERLIRQVVSVLGAANIVPALDAVVFTGDMARLLPPVSVRSAAARAIKPMVLDHPAEDWAAVRAAAGACDAALLRAGVEPTALIINGILIGFVSSGGAAAAALRVARRARRLPFDVAIELNTARCMLRITGEAGGLRRPLFVLDAAGTLNHVAAIHAACVADAPELFWSRLLAAGAVEYLSKHEEENALVISHSCARVRLHAPLFEHTHCEVHPSLLLGIAAAAIPLSEHNQAPRTSYYAGMSKQTAGTPPPDALYTSGMRLWYAQRPLTTTWAAKIHGIADAPMGLNVWIVVASDGGRNQEDSLYVNEDARNRGLFACTLSRSFKEDCQTGTGADAQHFEIPPPDCNGHKLGNYATLGPGGLVRPGTYVRGGDALIGKTMDVNEVGCSKRKTVRRDQSVVLPSRERPMCVDAVLRTRGRDDKDIAVVRAHTVRFLQCGDKLTSVHGQKGVTGHVRPSRDMPYTASGAIADVVINPHAIPSRMTVGHLLEAALGIVCATEAETADGTPFNNTDAAAAVAAALAAAGYEDWGHQVMYRGDTGERIEGSLFFGCMHYQRVKQMVDDKHHARARGPVHILTEQPVEGRAKDGGFRVGDMERDALVSHGAAFAVEDRLLLQSDYARIPICTNCSTVAMGRAPPDQQLLVVGRNELGGYCLKCKCAGTVHRAPLPYAAKLYAAELQAAHVRVEFNIDTRGDVNPVTTAAVGIPRASLAEEAALLQPTVQRERRAAVRASRKRTRTASADDTPSAAANCQLKRMPAGFGTATVADGWAQPTVSLLDARSPNHSVHNLFSEQRPATMPTGFMDASSVRVHTHAHEDASQTHARPSAGMPAGFAMHKNAFRETATSDDSSSDEDMCTTNGPYMPASAFRHSGMHAGPVSPTYELEEGEIL